MMVFPGKVGHDSYPPFPGVEPYGTQRAVTEERAHRKRVVANGYRIFAMHRWGQLGDGHVTARDPQHLDRFWVLDWAVPFHAATPDSLVLVGPDGEVTDEQGKRTGSINTAAYNIHAPLYAARSDVLGACHTHTQHGTPWSANVKPFTALSQESCAFVFDQALFNDEEVEVLTLDGGRRIASTLGKAKLCLLRNHGMLTVGQTVESAIGWFVMAERVAEVHVKAPNGIAISDIAAKAAADTLSPDIVGWRMYQWLVKSTLDRIPNV
jgi:ribulose-5-phosphate 4-epimerase/fuculose-1-phosphate aldolase